MSASEGKKMISMGPILDPVFMGMSAGGKALSPQLKMVTEKLTELKENPAVQKLTDKLTMLWALAGLVLVFHGNHFARVVLCVQAVILLGGFKTFTSSIKEVRDNITKALEKEGADAPAPAATTEEKDDAKNKHAAKREAAKNAKDDTKDPKKDTENARKIFQAMDTSKVHTAGLDLLSGLVVCTVIGRTGFVFALVVATTLSGSVLSMLAPLMDYENYEGDLIRSALFLVFVLLSMMLPSLSLALNHAAVGADLLLVNMALVLEGMGKKNPLSEDLTVYVKLGLVAFGALWQVWSVAAGSSVAWYLQYTIYALPCIAEAFMTML